ncbi:MAG: hypothetical protein F4Y03_07300 [Alphaproteobacteria bacterium]|nr:hypothetical protein [Alphaproteobacteria bacterium]
MSEDLGGRLDMFARDDPMLQALEEAAEGAGATGFWRRMERIEGLLEELRVSVAKRSDVERAESGRQSEFIELRGKLSDLSCDVLRIGEGGADSATLQDVQEVARSQRHEFGWLRESHAWLRGAVTVGAQVPRPDPAPRSRSGLAMVCLLWALTVLAAFGAGAVAFGGLRVDIAWEQGSARRAALASLHIDSVEERRLEQARAEGSQYMPVLVPRPREAVPYGAGVYPSVVPAEPPPDFPEPRDAKYPRIGPAPGETAGQGAAVPPPRRGPLVAEPGTP